MTLNWSFVSEIKKLLTSPQLFGMDGKVFDNFACRQNCIGDCFDKTGFWRCQN